MTSKRAPSRPAAAILIPVVLLLLNCVAENPEIVFETQFGNITAEVYMAQAPITASNFLRYVDEGRLEGAAFYRVVTLENQPEAEVLIQVVQGGLFEENHPSALPPIEHETTAATGILHEDGTLSMARLEPGTATCEFFICVGNQPELDFGGRRNPDGQGFAVFGRVVEGMEVVRRIHQLPAEGQYLKPHIPIRVRGEKENQ